MQAEGDCLAGRSAESKWLSFVLRSPVLVSLLALLSGCGGRSIGVASPALTLSPNSLSFPNEAPGAASAPQTVTVTNSGTATLGIVGIAVAANFEEADDCGSQVAVGTHCTIYVTFVPTTTGNLQGTVTLTDNAPGSPHNIALAGQGIVSGPPPQPTLTGYCSGGIAFNQCTAVKDTRSCPVGRVAAQQALQQCLPSLFVDPSTACQGKTSAGLTVKGECVVR